MTWSERIRAGWFFSPHLEAWQSEAVDRLKSTIPSDLIWILSSGTQSVKDVKAIGLSEAALLLAAEGANRHLQSDASDIWLVAIPSYHIGGLSIYARAHLSGAKVVEYSLKWNAQDFLSALSKNEITLTSLVPTQVHDLVVQGLRAPSSLRAVVVGGGALGANLYAQARNLGWPLLPSYGLTECCSQVATAELGSLLKTEFPSFKVLSHVSVELRDRRICLRSAALTRAVAVADRSGKIKIEDPCRDGWFETEDLGQWEGDKLKIIGRRDDQVKIFGVLVSVQETEQAVREHFQVEGFSGEFSVVVTPGAREGAKMLLVIEAESSLYDCQTLLAKFNARVKGPQRVSGLCWVPKIPRGELGKIRKTELLQLLG